MPLVEAGWLGSAGTAGVFGITSCGMGAAGVPLLLTPLSDASGDLRLIAWELEGEQLHRRGEGAPHPAIRIDRLASCSPPSDTGLAVTAVRESESQRLRLLFWSVKEGNGRKLEPYVAYEAHDAGGEHPVDQIAVAQCAAGIVTAVLRDDHKLAFTVWNYVEFSLEGQAKLGPHRLRRATRDLQGTRIDVAGWEEGIVTSVINRTSGKLQLDAWSIAPDGTIEHGGTATGPKVDDVAVTSISSHRVVTVARVSGSGKLEAEVWDLSKHGDTITARGTGGPSEPPEIEPGLAVCNLGPDVLVDLPLAPARVVAASHETDGGKLKLTFWDVSNGGELTRTDDAAFDRVEAIGAMSVAGMGTTYTTGGVQTVKSRALVAARRPNGDLGLFRFAAADDDVLPLRPTWLSIDFEMQHQQQSRWCWAATSVSVAHFYDPSSTWTQCKEANKRKGRTDCCGSGAAHDCNQGDHLEWALEDVGHFDRQEGPVSYDAVESEIYVGRPLCVRTAWSGGGAHFIAIIGYDGAEGRFVTVADPISGVSVWDFKTFHTAYKHTGTWTDSYYTRP